MRFRHLLTEDDAVSPVIGVILMVAITVILAAVIASFTLGLSGQASEAQPTSSFTFAYDNIDSNDPGDWRSAYDNTSGIPAYTNADGTIPDLNRSGPNGTLDITLSDGQAVQSQELVVRGDGFEGGIEELNFSDFDKWDLDEEVSSGEGVVVPVNASYELTIVWESADTPDSATLDTDTGPDV